MERKRQELSQVIINKLLTPNTTPYKSVEKLSQTVQVLLKKQRKKQKDLAKYVGESEATFSKKLSSENLTPQQMIKISQFLGVDLNFFTRDSNVKSATEQQNTGTNLYQEIIRLEQIIQSKDEVIKSKDQVIETLKEKLNYKT